MTTTTYVPSFRIVEQGGEYKYFLATAPGWGLFSAATFTSKEDALKGIEQFRKFVSTASVEDDTTPDR